MAPLQRRSPGWPALALALAAGASSPLAAAAPCQEPAASVELAPVRVSSDWQEFDAQGRRLVQESGTLQGTALALAVACDRWHLEAGLSQLDGTRAYDGQTNGGVAAQTQSAIRQSVLHLQAGLDVGAGWRLGARLSSHTTWREIASTATATGYPERFDWTLLALGAQWAASLGPGQLRLGAWAATPLTSGMGLALPGRDPAALKLGPLQQSEWSLGWSQPLGVAWSLQADLGQGITEFGPGADVAIIRSGVPVAVAHQPRTRITDSRLAIGLRYRF